MKYGICTIVVAFLSFNAFAAKCIAHRGYFAEVSENSPDSITAALEMGADGVEFDVWHTADGVPVLLHDETLARVNDERYEQCPINEPISQLRFKEIRDNCRLKDGQVIATLSEALERFKNSDKLVFVELKDMPNHAFASAINDSELNKKQIRFISFKTKYLRKAKKLMKGIESLRLSRFVPFFSFTRGMNVDRPLRRYTFVARLFGNEVGVWTINEREELVDNHKRKIDYITTDRIDLCLETK